MILWGAVIEHDFLGQNWLTFPQALALGGNIRKGEHGTRVVWGASGYLCGISTPGEAHDQAKKSLQPRRDRTASPSQMGRFETWFRRVLGAGPDDAAPADQRRGASCRSS
jgi:hypothetical protein